MSFVGFVPEPNAGRGTISILWSCATTIFLSTWTSFHMTLATDDYSMSSIHNARIYESIVCVLLPEGFSAVSIRDIFEAVALRRALRAVGGGWKTMSLTQAILYVKNGIHIFHQLHGRENLTTRHESLHRFARLGAVTIDDFPTDAQIGARAKKDWLSKTIAIFQALWFSATLASRLATHLQVSLLEDMTFAYVFCGLVMYVAWFSCPQDIQEPFVIHVREEKITRQYQRDDDVEELPNWAFYTVVALLLAVFAGIHLAGWHYPFPTDIERWLWRGGNVATFVFGFGATYLIISERKDTKLREITRLVLVGLYVLVRVAVVGLALAAFRKAPASIYLKPDWSAYMAHLGN